MKKLLIIACILAFYINGQTQVVHFVEHKHQAYKTICYVKHAYEADKIITFVNLKYQVKPGYWYVSPTYYHKEVIKLYVTKYKWEADWKIHVVKWNQRHKVKWIKK